MLLKSIIFVLLLSPFSAFCQSTCEMTTQFFVRNHVKKRTVAFHDWRPRYSREVDDYYTPDGFRYMCAVYRKVADSFHLDINKFFRNEKGNIDSVFFVSYVSNRSIKLSDTLLPSRYSGFANYSYELKEGRMIQNVITSQNKRYSFENNNDSACFTQITFEDLVPSVRYQVFYQAPGIPKRSFTTLFDSTGRKIKEMSSLFEHTLNKNNQVVESVFISDFCTAILKFTYYKNGLIRSEKKSYCSPGWTASYEYY